MEKKAISIEEVARVLGISKAQAYKLAREGVLPVLKLGERRVVVPIAAFERWLESAGSERKDSRN